MNPIAQTLSRPNRTRAVKTAAQVPYRRHILRQELTQHWHLTNSQRLSATNKIPKDWLRSTVKFDQIQRVFSQITKLDHISKEKYTTALLHRLNTETNNHEDRSLLLQRLLLLREVTDLKNGLKPELIAPASLEVELSIIYDWLEIPKESFANIAHSIPLLILICGVKKENNYKALSSLNVLLANIGNNELIDLRSKTPFLQKLCLNAPKLADFWESVSTTSYQVKGYSGSLFQLEEIMHPDDIIHAHLAVRSCQSPTGPSSLKVGLLGRILEGSMHLLCVKNPKGTPVARALVRLMEINGRPILTLSEPYINPHPLLDRSILVSQLNSYVSARAKELGIAAGLIQSNPNTSNLVKLKALGATIYPQYIDGAGLRLGPSITSQDVYI